MKRNYRDFGFGIIFYIPMLITLFIIEFKIINDMRVIGSLFFISLLFIIYYFFGDPIARRNNLEKFAKHESYDFFKVPLSNQLSEFKSFKSINRLKSFGDFNFINLLLPQQKISRDQSPKIVTCRREYRADELIRNYWYTQVYLFETNKDLPSFLLISHALQKNILQTESKLSDKSMNEMQMQNYEFIDIKNNDLVKNKYNLYSTDKNIESLLDREFFNFINDGIKKDMTVNIESNGRNFIFYVTDKRHSIHEMNFYINLFGIMTKKLLQ